MNKDEKTAKRFWSLIEKDNTWERDVATYQLFYVIARTDELWNVVDKIYAFQQGLVDGWEHLFDDMESDGDNLKKMLKRAVHMYNPFQSYDVNTCFLFENLSYRDGETMINAMKIYHGSFEYEILSYNGMTR